MSTATQVQEIGFAFSTVAGVSFVTVASAGDVAIHIIEDSKTVESVMRGLRMEDTATVISTYSADVPSCRNIARLTVIPAHRGNSILADAARSAARVYGNELMVAGTLTTAVSASYETTYADVYTDASQSRDNDGYGVSGWVRAFGNMDVIDDGFGYMFTEHSDTDRLEALGILAAIVAHKDFDEVNIFSDSTHGIRKAWSIIRDIRSGKIIRDEFMDDYISSAAIAVAVNSTVINMTWVKSHSDNLWNNAVDRLVVFVRKSIDAGKPMSRLRHEAGTILNKWVGLALAA